MAKTKFIGLDKVQKNLTREIKKIEGRTVRGLFEAALFVKAEALRQIPVDTGNLANSGYVIAGGANHPLQKQGASPSFSSQSREGEVSSEDLSRLSSEHASSVSDMESRVGRSLMPFAAIGFTAFYAVFVHEIQKDYVTGSWKFLETPLTANEKTILRIIQKRAMIK